ncbi:MAG: GAF domain-containing protein, partial [Aquabacterium sp.]
MRSSRPGARGRIRPAHRPRCAAGSGAGTRDPRVPGAWARQGTGKAGRERPVSCQAMCHAARMSRWQRPGRATGLPCGACSPAPHDPQPAVPLGERLPRQPLPQVVAGRDAALSASPGWPAPAADAHMNTACLVLLDGAHDSLDAVSAAVRQAGAQIDVSLANSPQVLESILERHAPVGVVTRARVWGQDVFEFLEPYGPQVAGIVALPSPDGAQVADALLNHHAIDIADPAQPMRFASAVRRLTSAIHGAQAEAKNAGLERLVDVVQELSRARTLDGVMAVVRRAARKLTGAQGACFVLREGDICYYADEDAISPLWKGQRFPADTCISGISMMSGEPVVIEDIFNDDRVPLPAYAPTFVRSLVMVPIRPGSSVGAIGTYWAWPRLPAHGEVELLQTLANATSLAIENAMTQQNLERLVAERTRELQATNEELDAFSASVSHDLRNRLNAAYGFCTLLELRATPVLDETSRGQLSIVKDAITQMTHTTGDLLTMARSGRQSQVLHDARRQLGEIDVFAHQRLP